MDQMQLDAILYRHHKWLRGMAGGERANLSDADLSRANLSDADLSRANLSRANLSDADLSRANLSRANLSDANLSDADLSDADLSDANLSDANLSDADLSRANLSDAKEDFLSIINSAPGEVPGLLAALREGRIDGAVYQGECACLVGTIANLRGVYYEHLDGIKPNGSRPAERLFLAVRKGDTPENNAVAKVVEGWILEWLEAPCGQI